MAWRRVLDELEHQLDAANQAATLADAPSLVPAPRWRPPTNLGPLPVKLEERARDLLLCQQKLIRELDDARRVAGLHLAAIRQIPPSRDLDRSVYLDISG
ncbi:hypothetical protein [Cryobacterium sp. CG_9.6]|uniref:hypothetical protein n=1 Tax=Cryobacterium sp. CG_9.6 TaxID=2760710 RepID=UPI002473691D|nr:hypothetical protein [Cryobacterium sp. CG_9.6]MDH6237283.1 hypothetical protein [Cryobacterium sp. CG_9.6]